MWAFTCVSSAACALFQFSVCLLLATRLVHMSVCCQSNCTGVLACCLFALLFGVAVVGLIDDALARLVPVTQLL